jgi:N utilization substance protein A
MVIAELGGEKIDIMEWSEDPTKFIASALSPAKVVEVTIDEAKHAAVVVVPENQLSLAIGRGGQNVRLAARLTGWSIDVRSAEAPEETQEEGIAEAVEEEEQRTEIVDGVEKVAEGVEIIHGEEGEKAEHTEKVMEAVKEVEKEEKKEKE